MNEADQNDYYKNVHLWGQMTLFLSVFLFLGIGCYLSFIRGLHPGWNTIFTAFGAVAAMVGHTWINIGDLVMYLLLMGPAATYMSKLTGNVKNMRLPSAMASCAALDESEGRIKRDILATYGVAVSVAVNTTFLILLVALGKIFLSLLSPDVLRLLDFIVPALFGAIFGQFAMKNIRAAAFSAVAVLVILYVPFIPGSFKAAAAILLSVCMNLAFQKKNKGET